MPTYIDLLVGPAVHAQRLHLGHVGAQFAVDGGASHAQEDTQLQTTMSVFDQRSASSAGACRNIGVRSSRLSDGRVKRENGGGRHTLHDAQPDGETELVPMLFAK